MNTYGFHGGDKKGRALLNHLSPHGGDKKGRGTSLVVQILTTAPPGKSLSLFYFQLWKISNKN